MDNYLEEAKRQVERVAKTGRIQFGVYNSVYEVQNLYKIKRCSVQGIKLEAPEVQEDLEMLWSNMEVSMEYSTLQILGKDEVREDVKKSTFVFLCPAGDTWGTEMDRLWKYGHPHTIAVDKSSYDVYMVYLTENGFIFLQFCQLSALQYTQVYTGVSAKTPYKYGIWDEAMYKFISNEVGWMELRRNLYLQFNTQEPIRIGMDYTRM